MRALTFLALLLMAFVGQAVAGDCRLESSTCVDSTPSKTISGVVVTLADEGGCWELQDNYRSRWHTATGNRFLMTDVLRKQWGFKGFVVTDYTGINEMIEHGMGNLQQVSTLALKAGIHMDMVGEGFLTTLKKSLAEGKVTLKEIDEACRLVLEAK